MFTQWGYDLDLISAVTRFLIMDACLTSLVSDQLPQWWADVTVLLYR